MRITLIGAGNMGLGIGTRVITAGHSLAIRDKDPQKAQELAATLGGDSVGSGLDGAIDGQIAIFALPYLAIFDVIERYGDQLSGKILVDISNPIDFDTFEPLPPADSSGVEEIAKRLPENARLVKAFNTTFAPTLVKGSVDGKPLDVFIASDDTDAAMSIVQLVNDSGLRGLYVGPLKRSRALEGIQLIHMSLQEELHTKWQSTIKILGGS